MQIDCQFFLNGRGSRVVGKMAHSLNDLGSNHNSSSEFLLGLGAAVYLLNLSQMVRHRYQLQRRNC